MNGTRAAQRVGVTVSDGQVVSQVGGHLLAELADRSGLTSGWSAAVPRTGERAPGHDRGRVLVHAAVAIACGGRCVADIAALGEQPWLFGSVASAPTIWRTISAVDDAVLNALRAARADARTQLWGANGDIDRTEVVLDLDATLVEVHTDTKQGAAAHFKGGFGFHPMLCFTDHSGEALAGTLRPGNANANTVADQTEVIDLAVAQLPAPFRVGHHAGDDGRMSERRLVVRADTASGTPSFAHAMAARNIEYSLGGRVSGVLDAAIAAVPRDGWRPARNLDGQPRHTGHVAELDVELSGWPPGTRAICRREVPHQGAQLRLWDHDGLRHQVVITNSAGDPIELEARHRAHARVENNIKALKDTGADRMPFNAFAANTAWLELCLAAADLLAWTQRLCFKGELAAAEPRTLRYRVLHCAARIIRRSRRVLLRLPRRWPWADAIANGYQHLATALA